MMACVAVRTGCGDRNMKYGMRMGAALTLLATSLAMAPGAVAGTHVYLMRGLADVSTGLDTLARKLKKQGIAAVVDSYTTEKSMVERAIADNKGKPGPIVIVGHSLGADAGVDMAEDLRAKGLNVALLVVFSPAYARDVPSNVGRVINYYQSNSFWNNTYRGGARFRGTLRNTDLAKNEKIDHFNIEKVPELHSAIIAEIRRLQPAPAVSAASSQPAAGARQAASAAGH